jgi:hypothetical protein
MMTLPVRVTLTRRIRTISPIPGMMARMKRVRNWFPAKGA